MAGGILKTRAKTIHMGCLCACIVWKANDNTPTNRRTICCLETNNPSDVLSVLITQVRAYICQNAGQSLSKACTIVLRYSAVRRQGFAEDGKSEVQVIDYKQQQHRLFPLLASSYCFFFTGKKVLERLQDIEDRFLTDKHVSKPEVTDIHASSSALKSFTTTVASCGEFDRTPYFQQLLSCCQNLIWQMGF